MEIEVKNISYTAKGKRLLSRVSFVLDSQYIYGITGHCKTLLLEILDFEKSYRGQILVDHTVVQPFNKISYQRQIALVSQKLQFFTHSVQEEMRFLMACYQYKPQELEKRMIDALRIVGLEKSYLTRKFTTLSQSEKVFVQVACALITNPKAILLDEIFEYLDATNRKQLFALFKKLQEKKQKLIVMASNDVNLLYEFTDKICVLQDGTMTKCENTTNYFKNIKNLEEQKMDIPDLVKFTNMAKKKGVKLSYHRDILDLIKDVYKHV